MKEMPPGSHVLAAGIQVVLDLSLLVAAFVAAYLLRFDFHIPANEVRNFVTQIPLVVLLQFVALTIAGARTSIWRYTDLAHVRSFPLRSAWFAGSCISVASGSAGAAPGLESTAVG